jgi:hypothetical protein
MVELFFEVFKAGWEARSRELKKGHTLLPDTLRQEIAFKEFMDDYAQPQLLSESLKIPMEAEK